MFTFIKFIKTRITLNLAIQGRRKSSRYNERVIPSSAYSTSKINRYDLRWDSKDDVFFLFATQKTIRRSQANHTYVAKNVDTRYNQHSHYTCETRGSHQSQDISDYFVKKAHIHTHSTNSVVTRRLKLIIFHSRIVPSLFTTHGRTVS